MKHKHKICIKCKKQKKLLEFQYRSDTGSYRPACKKCESILRKEKYKKNPDKFKQRNKKWNLENSEKLKKIKQREYNKNKENYIIRANKWCLNNSLKSKSIKINWKKQHPEQSRKDSRIRRARLYNQNGIVTIEEWLNLCNKYGNICLCCKKNTKLTQDHIVPLSKGGSHNINNIQPLCKSCNSKKGTRIIDYRI